MSRLPVLAPSDMRSAEEAARARLAMSSELLMEEAGRAVAEIVRQRYPGPVGLLVGPGQNGGDALVAGRLLRSWGREVRVFMASGAYGLKGAARLNERRLRFDQAVPWYEKAWPIGTEAVLVDGIFGTGLKAAPAGRGRDLIETAAGSRVPVVAVDVPSGLDADTGEAKGGVLEAEVTVALGAVKPGLLLGEGPTWAGEVVWDSIGLPGDLLQADVFWINGPEGLLPPWDREAHKGQRGRILIVAGSRGMAGAAALAGLGALRAAGGLVCLAVPEEIEGRYTALLPEALTLPLPVDDETAAKLVADRAQGMDALVLGPGLGRTERTAHLVEAALKIPVPLVLDADGLTVLGAGLSKRLEGRPAPTLLTPHEGEFRRIFPGLSGSALHRAGDAAGTSGATVLLKGPTTVVAGADGRAFLVRGGSDLLAQGGSGDVLSGIVGAFLARLGKPTSEVAAVAAAVHQRASVLLEETAGRGAGARALADRVPEAMKEATC